LVRPNGSQDSRRTAASAKNGALLNNLFCQSPKPMMK
jgi:hypothetical protein